MSLNYSLLRLFFKHLFSTDIMNFKELEKKYKDMDDEKWENLSDEEKKECDMYLLKYLGATSPYSPARNEWRKKGASVIEEIEYVPPEENTYEDP